MKCLNIKLLFIFLGITAFSVAQTVSTFVTSAAGGFSGPFGLACDGGNLYVADEFNNVIKRVTIPGAVVTTLAGTGATPSPYVDGVGTSATFNLPKGVAVDSLDNIYVTDWGNNVIRKITLAGVVSTLAGSTSGTAGETDGTGTAALFNGPEAITWGTGGYLYVFDHNGANTNFSVKVRKIVVATGVVTTIASGGVLGGPDGVVYDGAQALYEADATNDGIIKVTTAGVVSAFASDNGNDACPSGTGTLGNLGETLGVTSDGSGSLYVTNWDLDVIAQVVISTGVITKYAGICSSPGLVNTPFASATFNQPAGICFDFLGNLYISEQGNNDIRKISSTGILPIKLMQFTAEYVQGENSVALNWSTATETNNKLFTVEKSVDGLAFDNVSNIAGAGNSDMKHDYAAIDKSPFAGMSYYRLKQTDYDGKYTYSNVVPVLNQAQSGFNIFPNPVNSTMHVVYTSSANNYINLTVTDIFGKVLQSATYNVNRGDNNLDLNAQNIAQGVYMIEISTADGQKLYKKFIKQ